MVQTHTNPMTDLTLSEQAFSAVAAALAPLPPAEAEALLAFMLASVAVKYRTGLPASGIKAELAAKVGLAVDGLAGPAQAYDAAQVAG
jgi:hypothetical protein